MTTPKPKIASLTPVVLPDQRRVMLELVVENLPTITTNVTLNIPGKPAPLISRQNTPSQGRTTPMLT